MSYELDKLVSCLSGVRPVSWGFKARCPLHDDRVQSLSLAERDGKLLFKCHAGCSNDNLYEHFKAVGVWPESENKQTEWEIKDEQGNLVATHVRIDKPGGKKSFYWKDKFGNTGLGGVKLKDLPLYSCSHCFRSDKQDASNVEQGAVYVTEGEKACDYVARSLGLRSVGTVGGSGFTPGPRQLAPLKGHKVILWPDHDKPGHEHMAAIAAQLGGEVDIVDTESLFGPEQKGQDAADLREIPEGGIPVLKGGPPKPRPVYRRMSEIKGEEVEWLWEPYIPFGNLTLLVARAGTGKSWTAMKLASAVTNGESIKRDSPPTPKGNVGLLIYEEDDRAVVRPRADAMGVDTDKLIWVDGWQDSDGEFRGVLTVDNIDVLQDVIESENIRLLIIDPIQNFMGEGQEINNGRDVRDTLIKVFKLTKDTGCAVVALAHLRKDLGDGPALTGIQGSNEFGNLCRSAIGIIDDPSSDKGVLKYLCHLKHSYSEPGHTLQFRLEDDEFVFCGRNRRTFEEIEAFAARKRRTAPEEIHSEPIPIASFDDPDDDLLL